MAEKLELISHINLKKEKKQLLKKHIEEVSRIMVSLLKGKGIKDSELIEISKSIGLYHDFAKGSEYFQDYIRGKSLEDMDLKRHGEVSAYFTYYMLPEKWKIIGFILVKRHHGNIDNLDNLFFSPTNEEKVKKIVKSIYENRESIEKIYNINLDEFVSKINDESLFKEVKSLNRKEKRRLKGREDKDFLEKLLDMNMIYSLLLTADKSQLIVGKEFENKDTLKASDVTKYKDYLRERLIEKNESIKESHLFNMREDIIDKARNSIRDINLSKERIFSINVPTGTGKTIASYVVALDLIERIKKENEYISKFIYGINYNSVIDQNYKVLEDIFKFSNKEIKSIDLLKYHSLTEIEYLDNEGEKYEGYDAKFLCDNWQSSILVTTFVQIFNGIFKVGLNSSIHKFHNLAGSVIVLDEVQTIDPKFYKILEITFDILAKKYNSYILTITATKPLFLEGKELVKNNEEMFKSLDRIYIENHLDGDINLEEFSKIVKKDIEKNKNKSFLIILNTVQCAKEFSVLIDNSDEMLERKRYLLTSEILPNERLEIIEEIKNSTEPIILVATQLVEAGVDLDFNIVYRDLAPLDSINQSAGRGNRNGIKEKGIIKIYSILNSKGKRYSNIYSSILINITEEILRNKIIKENKFLEINKEYFSKVKKISNRVSIDLLDTIKELIKNNDFETLRNSFDLIEKEDFKEDLIIKTKEALECMEIIEKDENYLDVLNAWIRLNSYRISVSKYHEIFKGAERFKGIYTTEEFNYEKGLGIVVKSEKQF